MMSLRRRLLDFANHLLEPLGVALCRSGMDMESVLKVLAKRRGDNIATVFDIGASTGRWSAMTMPMLPHARFIGIDPLEERRPWLEKLKQSQSKFDYVLCAAGEEANGTVQMAVGDDPDTSTVHGSDGAMRTVALHSLDAIAEMKGTKGPYLLKFDTHGFEVPILNGAQKVLAETSYIVMEVYGYRHVEGTLLFWEMCQKLDAMGFRCFNLVDPMQRQLDKSLWQIDLFFARKDDVFFRSENYK